MTGDGHVTAGPFVPRLATAICARPRRRGLAPDENGRMLGHLARDIAYAARLLRRAPSWSAIAVLTLGLGIGANTAIFSVVQGLLLRPLPYPGADRLLFLDGTLARPEGDADFQLSYPDVEDIRQGRTLEQVTPWSPNWGLTIEGTGGAARLQANFVGAGYFALLGATPLAGRVLAEGDHAGGPGGPLVALLSEAAWREEFGADPALVGRDVRLQGRAFTVVGILPAAFVDVALAHEARIDVWVPIERAPALFPAFDLRRRGGRLLWAVARVAPGHTVASARAELAAISATAASAFPDTNRAFTYKPTALAQTFFAEARRPLWLLVAGAAFVLLIACANVANLLLVRAGARSREIAVRLAIGASRARVCRQLVVESLLLAGAGGAAGLVLAWWCTPLLVTQSGLRLPPHVTIGINGPVMAVAAVVALLCGLVFGLAPAWRSLRSPVRDGLQAARSRTIAGTGRAGRWLAGVEIAAAFILATGALLLVQSFTSMTRTGLGFDHARLLTVRVELPQDRYPDPAARARFVERALERLRAAPGVENALVWGPSMFARSTWVAFLTPDDRVGADDTHRLMAWRHSTNAGGLAALGIPLRAGRDFTTSDTADAPPVAIVSDATARRLFPGAEAGGRRFQLGAGPAAAMVTVVGVAADASHRGRFRFSDGAAAHRPQVDVYFPYPQVPNALLTIGVRAAGDAGALTGAVRAALGELDPALAVFDIAPLEHRLALEASSVRYAALLMNVYGALALVLAAIGVYGVFTAAVSARVRELGVRSALGATPGRLRRGVLAEGLGVAVMAIVPGAIGAWMLGHASAAVLFGVTSSDPRVLAGAVALLLAVSAAASYLPARRAARVDPARVLRSE